MEKIEFMLKCFKYFVKGIDPDFKTLDANAKKLGVTRYTYLDSPKHGATGVVVQHPQWPDTTFIMFNGTYPTLVQSDLSDLDVFPRTPLIVGKGHRGFTEIQEILTAQIPSDYYNVGTIDVFGHSMGAGVASIFCVNTTVHVSSLTLLALPPSLNKHAHDYLKLKVSNITSYLNENDVIFWSTPWPWFRRGKFTWIGEHGWFHGANVLNHVFVNTEVLGTVTRGYVASLGYNWDTL